MESTEIYIGPEPHIEVHKYYGGVVPAVVVLALVLQAFFPAHFRWANYLELPLLVTLYFALSKRNPSSGLLLGTVIGLLQDSLSRTPLGLYGIAKTLVGYAGSSIGTRIDVEHPIARFLLPRWSTPSSRSRYFPFSTGSAGRRDSLRSGARAPPRAEIHRQFPLERRVLALLLR